MKRMFALSLLLIVAACSSKASSLKSRCVGIEKSSCVGMPINEGVA